ncbi:MAG: hypothetical protein EOO19_06135 [Chryseobacterium sp.]|nr:MAG: hypothetical protein EOO19_06135 [Chryseobacterium sp.]
MAQAALERNRNKFKLEDAVMKDLKRDIYAAIQKVKDDKSYLIRRITGLSIDEKDLKRIGIRNQFEISFPNHNLKADHAVIQLWNLRAIIISDDKFLDMGEAIIQNLDQLRTYAHSIEGSQFPISYGIASNFHTWRFCCYIPSSNKKIDTCANFHISKEFQLKINIDSINTRPTYANELFFKFINKKQDLEKLLTNLIRTGEVYQFFIENPISILFSGKHIEIEIENIEDIKNII